MISKLYIGFTLSFRLVPVTSSPQRTRLSAGATRLGRGIQKKELDYPVKPDNDNHWNIVRYK